MNKILSHNIRNGNTSNVLFHFSINAVQLDFSKFAVWIVSLSMSALLKMAQTAILTKTFFYCYREGAALTHFIKISSNFIENK